MTITKPQTYQSDTSVSTNSTGCHFIDGEGTFQIKGASGLTATVGISLDGGTTYDQDSDATSITADGVYAFDANSDCIARIQVAAGSCDVIAQSRKRY